MEINNNEEVIIIDVDENITNDEENIKKSTDFSKFFEFYIKFKNFFGIVRIYKF